MANQSLKEAVDATPGGTLQFLKNVQARSYTFPVQAEFSNWRSEQSGWRETAALLNQSHHMTDLFIKGPDAVKLLSFVGINGATGYGKNQAKQFVAVNHEGYLIGDAIVIGLEDDHFDLAGHPPVLDWLAFQCQKHGFDVTLERDENSIDRPAGPPKLYRYEIQGPNAMAVMRDLCEGEVPEVKFFHMASVRIAGVEVRALRHGMSGEPGFELLGPWTDHARVHDAIVAAGQPHGLKLVGAKAYSAANLESAWVPAPFPALYSGQEMDEFARWQRASGVGALGGSMDSAVLEDYYVTPWDLGYGRLIKFDHDFIGRQALEARAKQPHRRKVTLVWDDEDMMRIMRSQWEPGLPAKYFDLPKARYALHQSDQVLADGKRVGLSMDVGYLVNERKSVSLAVVDEAFATPGTRLTLLWGENSNSTKPRVEAHRQVEVHVTVAPAPYATFAREAYRKN